METETSMVIFHALLVGPPDNTISAMPAGGHDRPGKASSLARRKRNVFLCLA
jgi:hypothetical protein